MLAVAGGDMFVRCGWGPSDLRVVGDVVDGVSDFGLGGEEPYFSRSCWVELYLVACLRRSMVASRSL